MSLGGNTTPSGGLLASSGRVGVLPFVVAEAMLKWQGEQKVDWTGNYQYQKLSSETVEAFDVLARPRKRQLKPSRDHFNRGNEVEISC